MKRFIKKLWLLKKDDSGAVIILVALSLVVLMGMTALAVDGGVLYQTRREMVNAADSSALAGAQELIFNNNNGQVEAFAENFALNHYNCDAAQATVINSYTVGVETYKTVDYYFAGFLKVTPTVVSAYAEAMFTPLVEAGDIVPWGVPASFLPEGWDDPEYEPPAYCDECENPVEDCECDNYIILKVGPPGGGGASGEIGPGNFHALALGGTGGNVYRDNIKYGYDGTISACDHDDCDDYDGDCWLLTEPGNTGGPTGQGVEYRIDQCNHTEKIGNICKDRSCARYVTVPVFDDEVTDTQGRTKIHVIGFATFYLIDYYKEQSTHIVRAIFVEKFIADGKGTDNFDPTFDFGTYNLRLIK